MKEKEINDDLNPIKDHNYFCIFSINSLILREPKNKMRDIDIFLNFLIFKRQETTLIMSNNESLLFNLNKNKRQMRNLTLKNLTKNY